MPSAKDQVYKVDSLIAKDIDAYLELHQKKSLLRIITCGSVDDGKSTLIGRLLYDSKMIFEDQLTQLKFDSKKVGTQGQEIDFALLVDGLAAEREQGITIDVAYRFFSTDIRKFIIADTPGHEQYTRNMVTGASTAEMAIILVDARKGVLTQTRRHSYICHLLGINNIVLAVNKMDLVKYKQEIFNQIVLDYQMFSESIGIKNFIAVPVSFKGDNIVEHSKIPHGIKVQTHGAFRSCGVGTPDDKKISNACPMGNCPNLDFRGFSKIAEGSISPNDEVSFCLW